MPIKPYNTLQQILSAGGSIALGVSYALRWSKDRISGLFARKFEPMIPSEKSELIQIAMQGVRAAQLFDQLPKDQLPDPATIPINPYLPETTSGGGRVLHVVDYSANQGANTLQDRIITEDFKTPEEIADETLNDAFEIAAHEYERLVELYGEKPVFDWWKTLYMERGF